MRKVILMGFVKRRSRRGGVVRCVGGSMGATCASCSEGRGGAVQGPAGRGAFLYRVVTVRWSGCWGSVLRRRGARVWLPDLSIPWVGRLW